MWILSCHVSCFLPVGGASTGRSRVSTRGIGVFLLLCLWVLPDLVCPRAEFGGTLEVRMRLFGNGASTEGGVSGVPESSRRLQRVQASPVRMQYPEWRRWSSTRAMESRLFWVPQDVNPPDSGEQRTEKRREERVAKKKALALFEHDCNKSGKVHVCDSDFTGQVGGKVLTLNDRRLGENQSIISEMTRNQLHE